MSVLGSLGESLSGSVKKIFRFSIIDEKAVKEIIKDLQRALLQADVNANLVLELSKKVEERSLREKVPTGISRKEHIIKVLYEELTKFLGDKPVDITTSPEESHIIMLIGIQGSGKTTTGVKVARFFQKRGLKTVIVCADTFRPGAYDQLKQLADTTNIEVYGDKNEKKSEVIVSKALSKLKEEKTDLILVDTAGRHKDEQALMNEMQRMHQLIKPNEVILVIDGTIGQQAMRQAKAFNELTKIGTIIVTKLDGSAKGGGALSAAVATGAKIKFIGTGEKIDDLEQFIPSNFVGKLLGMGDIEGLIKKVKEVEKDVSKEKIKSFAKGKFTLQDLYEQMESMRRLGPLRKVWSMIPGGHSISDELVDVAEQKLDSWKVILQSMRRDELEEPKILNASRIRRIARGSGKSEKDVKELVNQYNTVKKMMKSFKRRGTTIFKKARVPF
ncbi:MAG: signal recognition particle protein Srp54 [Candidatus Bathyarchaeota archaeon]|nr:signal recognition particle protein Srp54 [Candidatus Bathyarchaeota archaeon]MCZ2845295.1 signal recognition particle protein Srp54 [Candidatus Bathyarchaeota archaeon]